MFSHVEWHSNIAGLALWAIRRRPKGPWELVMTLSSPSDAQLCLSRPCGQKCHKGLNIYIKNPFLAILRQKIQTFDLFTLTQGNMGQNEILCYFDVSWNNRALSQMLCLALPQKSWDSQKRHESSFTVN